MRLIDKDSVLDKFAAYVGAGMSMNDYDALEDIVINEPEVIQPQGEWLRAEWLRTGEADTFYDLPIYECSKCGMTSLENGNYCPNCGIKMESEG